MKYLAVQLCLMQRAKRRKRCPHCDLHLRNSRFYVRKRMYYSAMTGVWQKKVEPSLHNRDPDEPNEFHAGGGDDCVPEIYANDQSSDATDMETSESDTDTNLEHNCAV